jgi:magnesium chelatase subunit H
MHMHSKSTLPPLPPPAGTAALLNVPKSLEALLHALRADGYDLGPAFDPVALSGEALVTALKAQEDQRVISRGMKGVQAVGAGDAAAAGFEPSGAEVAPAQLKQWLSFPEEWGPSEWGPMPFLPEPDVLVRRLEGQWGELRNYSGLSATATHDLLVPGLQVGGCGAGCCLMHTAAPLSTAMCGATCAWVLPGHGM